MPTVNRRPVVLVALLALTLAVLGSYAVGTVFAGHFLHVGMDENHQETGPNDLPENYVSSRWALGAAGTTVRWHADANIRDRVVAALATWTAAVPELRWAETQNANAANVQVQGRDSCGTGLAGFFKVIPQVGIFLGGWEADSDRSANYWRQAIICLKLYSASNVSDNLLQAIAAHEIGHAYGLHEVYFDDPAHVGSRCNDAVTSIMDGVHTGATPTHCDDLSGPSSWDLRFVISGHFNLSSTPCPSRSDGETRSERFTAPATITLIACSSGSGYVRLEARASGAVLDRESIRISPRSTATPTPTPTPRPTATPTPTPRPTATPTPTPTPEPVDCDDVPYHPFCV